MVSMRQESFDELPQDVLASCLCVTEGRTGFMPWLLWCFDRQVWPRRELVIIDSSAQPLQIAGRENIRVLKLPTGTGVSKKRNLALQEARGEIVTWFDDDDWQHPQKLVWLFEALRTGRVYAGSTSSWFVDLSARRCARYQAPKGRITFNSGGFRRGAVLPFRFREDLQRASDTHWMRAVAARYRGHCAIIERDDLFFWLSHRDNLSNASHRRQFPDRLTLLRRRIGAEAWGDTDDALESLRRRVDSLYVGSAGSHTRRDRLSIAAETRDFTSGSGGGPGPHELPPVGLMIKATVLDTPFLDVMVRHVIGQAHYSFVERAIIVDRPPVFSGKFSKRPRTSQEELDRVLDGLLRDGVVDCVREVDLASETIEAITARYFPSSVQRVPTHSASGSAIYATLFGLESMSTDHVVQMEADILFHTGPASWIVRALQCMEADPRLWLMMTHPGPPVGPTGGSLGPENRRRAMWDAKLGIWRFRHATTRYFLCDRRTLRNRLSLIQTAGVCAELEQCISHALKKNGAFRGNLGDLQSWHLHVWYHGEPFPAWAPLLIRAVEAGSFPPIQRGHYDLRLDRLLDRCQWEQCIKPSISRTPVNGQSASSMSRVASVVSVVGRAPVGVIIPVRDRAGARLRNTLRSLQWQLAGPPAEVMVVSHGSRPDVDGDLEKVCRNEGGTLITVGSPADPWNKSLALNTGIRRTKPEVPFLMTMDADMVLSPDFLGVVVERLMKDPPALVLCRISDLPPQTFLPLDGEQLLQSFDRLRAVTQLRSRSASGGIQAASRSFFFAIRGYDEDLTWWGAMDGDILNRAHLMGLVIEWIEDRTTMLHQWHLRKHVILARPEQIHQARRAWRHNHLLVRARANLLLRNPKAWGGDDDDAIPALTR
jgi:glycosyltransferase involved in cell wall biosynthesis